MGVNKFKVTTSIFGDSKYRGKFYSYEKNKTNKVNNSIHLAKMNKYL